MEDDLILRVQQGDMAAFQRIVEMYTPLAWRTARVLITDRALAEDALQEAWIDVWRGLPRFQQGKALRPWLLTLVANRCRMVLRRAQISTVPFESEAAQRVVTRLSMEDDAAQPILDRERYNTVRAVLAALPPDQQRILELRYFADLDLNEIALVLSIPIGTVKSRLHRAITAMRENIRSSIPSATAWEFER